MLPDTSSIIYQVSKNSPKCQITNLAGFWSKRVTRQVSLRQKLTIIDFMDRKRRFGTVCSLLLCWCSLNCYDNRVWGCHDTGSFQSLRSKKKWGDRYKNMVSTASGIPEVTNEQQQVHTLVNFWNFKSALEFFIWLNLSSKSQLFCWLEFQVFCWTIFTSLIQVVFNDF